MRACPERWTVSLDCLGLVPSKRPGPPGPVPNLFECHFLFNLFQSNQMNALSLHRSQRLLHSQQPVASRPALPLPRHVPCNQISNIYNQSPELHRRPQCASSSLPPETSSWREEDVIQLESFLKSYRQRTQSQGESIRCPTDGPYL